MKCGNTVHNIIKMKTTATIIVCALMCAFGSQLAKIHYEPTNTITAAESPPFQLPKYVEKVVHDTITPCDTIRDTVHHTKVITKQVIRTKRVPYAVRDTVSILYIKTREPRKGTAPDSIPRKYVIHDAVDSSE